jgi:predicted dehydrogenase
MKPSPLSRRRFIKSAAAVSVLAGVKIPFVHAAEDNTLQLALIGCGGRGTGAASNALSVTGPPIKLVAMADVFERKLKGSLKGLQSQHPTQVDVPEDRQFISFDGYRNAIDALKPGGIAIFTSPVAFRWVHYKYAIEKGINVFMEKPISTDGPTTRRMLELNKLAMAKNMKVAVGLMCRHCKARKELSSRIEQGELGDILLLRAYRVQAPVASFRSKKKPDDVKELHYQIDRFHSFLWASGGAYSDFNIHNIDEACWMKGAWPVEAKGNGGRHYRDDWVDQNFDAYSTEFTFADGTKFFFESRNIEGCHGEFATYAHGTKGLALVSSAGHSPAKCKIFKGQNLKSEDIVWAFPQPEPNPYQVEWDDFIEAIRTDKPYNEVQRSAEASLVTAMGRMASHTGQVIKYDEALAWEHEFAPDVDKLTMDSPAPLLADANGKYPVPQPGITKKREY